MIDRMVNLCFYYSPSNGGWSWCLNAGPYPSSVPKTALYHSAAWPDRTVALTNILMVLGNPTQYFNTQGVEQEIFDDLIHMVPNLNPNSPAEWFNLDIQADHKGDLSHYVGSAPIGTICTSNKILSPRANGSATLTVNGQSGNVSIYAPATDLLDLIPF